ncbi:helix-turn-helix domain-containing protein [Deinococcus radiopugnans]|uniref:helix-turn-helix domain-containing protein n=1 Tax=Deinococcus radiopugnans TaxID=57497 RepID=UPI0009DD0F74
MDATSAQAPAPQSLVSQQPPRLLENQFSIKEAFMSTDLLSVRDAAKRLAVHPKTVRALIHRGELRAVRPLGKMLRIPIAELDRWIHSQLTGDQK